MAAKLAVGYTLDELSNEITGGATPASFEPTIDYVVTKVPRFTFEKFPQAEPVLGTQMKSVGEVMAIGRTFKEALGKALRSLELAAAPVRAAAGQSLLRAQGLEGPSRALALALRAVALAPRSAPDPAARDRALAPISTRVAGSVSRPPEITWHSIPSCVSASTTSRAPGTSVCA